MDFDLSAVIAALVTAGFGSFVAIATSRSPANRRIKRLEQLVAIRAKVEDPDALVGIDYAIDELATQIAQDATLLGNRWRASGTGLGILLMFLGIGVLVYGQIMTASGELDQGDPWENSVFVGAGIAVVIGFLGVLFLNTIAPGATADVVRMGLIRRRVRRARMTRAEHFAPKGNEPRAGEAVGTGIAGTQRTEEDSGHEEHTPTHIHLDPPPEVHSDSPRGSA